MKQGKTRTTSPTGPPLRFSRYGRKQKEKYIGEDFVSTDAKFKAAQQQSHFNVVVNLLRASHSSSSSKDAESDADSGRGSSIGVPLLPLNMEVGGIFWCQFSTNCWWPALVCSDSNSEFIKHCKRHLTFNSLCDLLSDSKHSFLSPSLNKGPYIIIYFLSSFLIYSGLAVKNSCTLF